MPLKVKNPTKPTKQKTSNQTPPAKPNQTICLKKYI